MNGKETLFFCVSPPIVQKTLRLSVTLGCVRMKPYRFDTDFLIEEKKCPRGLYAPKKQKEKSEKIYDFRVG